MILTLERNVYLAEGANIVAADEQGEQFPVVGVVDLRVFLESIDEPMCLLDHVLCLPSRYGYVKAVAFATEQKELAAGVRTDQGWVEFAQDVGDGDDFSEGLVSTDRP